MTLIQSSIISKQNKFIGKSLQYTQNKRGPRQLPWVTPNCSQHSSDNDNSGGSPATHLTDNLQFDK